MFKAHPITTLINLLILITAFLFLNNSIFIFFLALTLVFSNRHTLRKNYYNLLKIIFILAIINLLFGYFTLLIKILLVIVYLIEGYKDYTKVDLLYVYDTLFPYAPNFTLWLLKCSYYKETLKNKYKTLVNIEKQLGYKKNIEYYFYIVKSCIQESKKEIDSYRASYEKSLYLNKDRNRYKIPFSKEDALLIVIHIIAILLIYYLGRSPYAIFN